MTYCTNNIDSIYFKKYILPDFQYIIISDLLPQSSDAGN